MFKFLHAADIHLDSPLRGLERYEGAPADRIRGASRRAFENLVQLALEEKVAFVLLAGDLYDGDWRDFNTGLFLVREMKRLENAGIQVVSLAGNHDAANRMTRSLTLPTNVTVLSAKKPERRIFDDFDVAVSGQGFATQAVWNDLSQNYPAADRGCFNIGLLHTCATCTDGHERYAPCTIDGLRSKGYDYWALGHVHQRQTLHTDPAIVFPGNVQGRHIGEAGPKGCYLVTVDDNRDLSLEFRCLDVVRWHLCKVASQQLDDAEDVIERIIGQLEILLQDTEPALWAVRVEVHGACKAHALLHARSAHWIGDLRARALTLDPERLWLERVAFKTAAEVDSVPHSLDGPLEELATVLNEYRADPTRLGELAESFADFKRKLPADLTQAADGLDPTNPDWLLGMLNEVEPVLRQRLLVSDDAP